MIKIKNNILLNIVMEPFWYEDFSVLYKFENLTKFFPSRHFNYAEKLNALVRFSFYIAFLLVLYKNNSNYLYIPIITLLITYYLFNNRDKVNEFFNGSYIDNNLKPTYDNPFMNPNLIVHDPKTFLPKQTNKKVRFDVNHHIDTNDDVKTKEEIADKFNARLYQSVGDIFEKENSQRQFYSVPSRTYPNDQTAFAKWCYGLEDTCKAGNDSKCLNYDNELRGSADVESIRTPGPSSVTLRKDWY
jgi:hypothetical protein